MPRGRLHFPSDFIWNKRGCEGRAEQGCEARAVCSSDSSDCPRALHLSLSPWALLGGSVGGHPLHPRSGHCCCAQLALTHLQGPAPDSASEGRAGMKSRLHLQPSQEKKHYFRYCWSQDGAMASQPPVGSTVRFILCIHLCISLGEVEFHLVTAGVFPIFFQLISVCSSPSPHALPGREGVHNISVSFLSLLLDQGLDSRLFVPALDAAQSQQQCLTLPADLSQRSLGTQRGQGFGSFFGCRNGKDKHLSTVLTAELFPGLTDQTQLVT